MAETSQGVRLFTLSDRNEKFTEGSNTSSARTRDGPGLVGGGGGELRLVNLSQSRVKGLAGRASTPGLL